MFNVFVASITTLTYLGQGFASPVLSPDVIHSCSGENVTFTCVVTNGNWLYWQVDYSHPSWSDVSTLRYSVTDRQGKIMQRENNVDHIFLFNLTDNSRLNSTATTTVVDGMNGTRVYCQDAAMNRATSVIQVIKSPVLFNGEIEVDVITYNHMSAYVNMLWSANAAGVYKYYVRIMTSNELVDKFTTSNTSIIYSLHYNQEYQISVVANNCAGNTTPVTTYFNIVQCAAPVIGSNVSIDSYSDYGVEGSQVTYTCDSGLQPSTLLVSNCTKSGEWFPDPAGVVCREQSHCSVPVAQERVVVLSESYSTTESSIINFTCVEGFTPNFTITSVCTSLGEWNPDPADYICFLSKNKTNLKEPGNADCSPICLRTIITRQLAMVLVSSLSLGVLSVLLITMIICLCLCRRSYHLGKTSAKEEQHLHDPEPVYESVIPAASATSSNDCTLEMSNNAAYGRCRYIYM